MLIGIIFVVTVLMLATYFTVSQVNINSSGSNKARGIAIQAADAGINQFISDITNRKVEIIGATLPLTRNYPVTLSGTTLTVPVSIDYLRVSGTPVKDLEGNNKYTLDAVATPIIACLLYTSPSPRDRTRSRMPSSA